MSASSLFSCFSRPSENSSGKPSSACFFHWAICVGCTPYSAAISLAVFCPLIASRATLAFKAAVYRLRWTDIVFLLLTRLSIQLFYLIDWSRFLVPLYLHKRGLKYLLRENDRKFGVNFARVAGTSRIEILKTPYHAPRANAICERFLGSVRRECLDHLLILHEKQLHRVLNAYVQYFNRARPHQGIKQQIPEPHVGSVPPGHAGGKVISSPVLGGLHHDYRRSA